MSQKSEQRVLKADELRATPERGIAHPLNPNSEVYLRSLSERTGMSRVVVTMARLPPGRDSFAYHRHLATEEFVFILSGRGLAEVGDQSFEVGAGDFLGFPAGSEGHNLKNPFDVDLVYLMGGERVHLDVGEFARIGKYMIFEGETVRMVDSDALKAMSWSEWLKK